MKRTEYVALRKVLGDYKLLGLETNEQFFDGSSAVRAKKPTADTAHNGWPTKYKGRFPSFELIAYSQQLRRNTIAEMEGRLQRKLGIYELQQIPAALSYPRG